MLSENEIRNQLKQNPSNKLIDKSTHMQFSFSIVPLKSSSLKKIEVYWDKKINHKIIKRVLLREFDCKSVNTISFASNVANAINLYLKSVKNS